MSAIPRLHVDADLAANGLFDLGEGQSKYLSRVMRLGVGDAVRVFNGRDGEWQCAIESVQGKRVALQPLQQTREQAAAFGPQVTLLFAPLKKAKTDFVIEKATELGVSVIWPVITERTQTRNVRVDRLSKIAIEAAEQTERLDVPVMQDALSLDAALEALPPDTALIYCDEAFADSGENTPIQSVLHGIRGQPAAILIGPEGGFSVPERESLRARAGVHAVSLGPRILRAETAVAASLALWQSICGDWQ